MMEMKTAHRRGLIASEKIAHLNTSTSFKSRPLSSEAKGVALDKQVCSGGLKQWN